MSAAAVKNLSTDTMEDHYSYPSDNNSMLGLNMTQPSSHKIDPRIIPDTQFPLWKQGIQRVFYAGQFCAVT